MYHLHLVQNTEAIWECFGFLNIQVLHLHFPSFIMLLPLETTQKVEDIAWVVLAKRGSLLPCRTMRNSTELMKEAPNQRPLLLLCGCHGYNIV